MVNSPIHNQGVLLKLMFFSGFTCLFIGTYTWYVIITYWIMSVQFFVWLLNEISQDCSAVQRDNS